MKIPSLFCLILIFAATNLSSQIVVDGVKLSEPQYQFCEVVGTDYNTYKKKIYLVDETKDETIVETAFNLVNKESTIYIDVGQEIDWQRPQDIRDQWDNPIKFKSVIQALNLLSNKGWEFVSFYSNEFNGVSETHYLLRRKILENPVGGRQ